MVRSVKNVCSRDHLSRSNDTITSEHPPLKPPLPVDPETRYTLHQSIRHVSKDLLHFVRRENEERPAIIYLVGGRERERRRNFCRFFHRSPDTDVESQYILHIRRTYTCYIRGITSTNGREMRSFAIDSDRSPRSFILYSGQGVQERGWIRQIEAASRATEER